MAVLTFRLSLTRDEVLRYYEGSARAVQARSTDGRSVQFPAAVLRRHVTPDGVHGTFRMMLDARNRLVSFERVR
jgi:hypothetical protein